MRKPKVQLVRFGEKAETTARSLLVAGSLGGVLVSGCGPDAAERGNDAHAHSQTEEALTQAGSGVLELAWGWRGPGFYPVSSTVDEFTRAGQTLKLQVPAWYIWDQLYPGTELGNDDALKKLRVIARIRLWDDGALRGTRVHNLERISGTSYDLRYESPSFTLPSWTDALNFTLTVTDVATDKTVTLGQAPDFLTGPAVFGGQLPNKTAYFDNTVHGELRERIIEFGSPAAGSELSLVFSEYRADQLVSRMEMNTQTGRARFPTRFGTIEGAIYGRVVYEVLVGHRLDGGEWQPEMQLGANNHSLVLGPGRTTFERKLPLPADASRVDLYFHVRAWLEVDYGHLDVIDAWYRHGERVLLKDAWDNPETPGTNYGFRLE